MRQNYQIKQYHKIKEDTRIYGIRLQWFYTTYKVAEVIGNIRCYRNKIEILQMFLAETADWCCRLPGNGQIKDHTTVATVTLSVKAHAAAVTHWHIYAGRSRVCTQTLFEHSCCTGPLFSDSCPYLYCTWVVHHTHITHTLDNNSPVSIVYTTPQEL